MTKTIFWNVDTQYDFMREGRALPIAGAEAIEENLARLTRLARERNLKVVNTADWHNESTEEISATPDYRTTFPPHCLEGTEGAAFVPVTAPENPYTIDWKAESFDADEVQKRRNVVLYKDKFDIFAGSPHADDVLRILAPERAIVYGVATNVCVNYAVLGLRKRGIEVLVPTDAIKELPGLPLENILKEWENNGAKLITVDEVVKYL